MRLREEGSASVLVIGGASVLFVLLGVALLLAAMVRATHTAQGAADLAALAAAQAVESGQPVAAACNQARVLARANGARLASCEPITTRGGSGIRLRVQVATRLGPATAEAVAGPSG